MTVGLPAARHRSQAADVSRAGRPPQVQADIDRREVAGQLRRRRRSPVTINAVGDAKCARLCHQVVVGGLSRPRRAAGSTGSATARPGRAPCRTRVRPFSGVTRPNDPNTTASSGMPCRRRTSAAGAVHERQRVRHALMPDVHRPAGELRRRDSRGQVRAVHRHHPRRLARGRGPSARSSRGCRRGPRRPGPPAAGTRPDGSRRTPPGSPPPGRWRISACALAWWS